MKKIALILTLTSLPLLANANLVTNGSFEADVQANGTWGIYNNLTGWTGASEVELRNNVAGIASEGVNFVELDTKSNNSIFQMISTTVGDAYDLSFDYSPRMGVSSQSNRIQAFWNGSLLTQVTGSGIGKTGNNWYTLSFSVLGTGNDKLTFSAAGISDSFGGSLDNVSLVSLVPEPGIWSSLSAGLMLMGFMAFRRKKPL
ncbi:MAG: PEP-CTERM sorting domain-containing protein [Methylotenera sp.]|nr:PEP-CTERM sorting domain-containing protein [Methylotenera sp.]